MTMTSLPSEIWNEIAETQTLTTAWGKKMFPLPAERIAEEEDKEFDLLTRKGIPEEVAIALADVKPLILERTAISRHLRKHPDLREALPEVNTIQEAARIGSMERLLMPEQEEQLADLIRKLLRQEMPPEN